MRGIIVMVTGPDDDRGNFIGNIFYRTLFFGISAAPLPMIYRDYIKNFVLGYGRSRVSICPFGYVKSLLYLYMSVRIHFFNCPATSLFSAYRSIGRICKWHYLL